MKDCSKFYKVLNIIRFSVYRRILEIFRLFFFQQQSCFHLGFKMLVEFLFCLRAVRKNKVTHTKNFVLVAYLCNQGKILLSKDISTKLKYFPRWNNYSWSVCIDGLAEWAACPSVQACAHHNCLRPGPLRDRIEVMRQIFYYKKRSYTFRTLKNIIVITEYKSFVIHVS